MMSKKILNMTLFKENLKKVEVPADNLPSTNTVGLSRVIRYVWNHYPTSLVDFDSFTLEDLYEAKGQMYMISEDSDDDEDDDYYASVVTGEGEEKIIPPVNAWNENHLVESICAVLYRTKKILYENDDDFI